MSAGTASAASNAAAAAAHSSSSSRATTATTLQQVVIGVDGGTESVRACCFDAVTGAVIGTSCAVPYATRHDLHPGWAEQDPAAWWEGAGRAVRGALSSSVLVLSLSNNNSDDNSGDEKKNQFEICGMAVDTTCCSVVALDADNKPLRPCLLWMDQRSAPQAATILELCRGDPALSVNCNGDGPLSAEWMLPKALWIRENEPDIWNEAATICEYQDYLNYKLTGGVITASSCNAASRWHWDGDLCITTIDTIPPTDKANPFPGRPLSLYQRLGIPELASKLPAKCLAMGSKVGTLTAEAAEHLGLPVGLPVIQGGPDAFVGMLGMGCIAPGQMSLITGSSHLHCVITSKPTTAPGTWGAYRGAPLPGLNFAEGGQSSTGSILRWARNIFGGTDDDDDAAINYKILDMEANAVAPGADGLIALETFQGSRTPVTDPLARGALIGLTLSHRRGHIWRALLEAVCFGTRACIEGLEAAGHGCDEIIMAGGATRTELWLQMHADVTGKTVTVRENSDASLLGCAILASVGVGIYKNVPDAVSAMVRTAKHIQPDPAVKAKYDEIYREVYSKIAVTARPLTHAIHNLRGGGSEQIGRKIIPLRGGETASPGRANDDPVPTGVPIHLNPTISPSLLACDWANMQSEVHRCLALGLKRVHVDIFDGVFLDSPNALTFGPQMVEAIRRSCDSFPSSEGEGNTVFLDLHMCVDRPARFVKTMASAGGHCFIFQLEAIKDIAAAIKLAENIAETGMKCGVSVNPATRVDELYPLLETNLVDVVDILAVEPGFGGQEFQAVVLEKVRELKKWRGDHGASFDIMVDGGMNEQTSIQVIDAGADILVAGTYLFKHPDGLARGAETLGTQRRG